MQPIRTMRPAEAGFAPAARRLLRMKLPPAVLLAAAAAAIVAAAAAATGWRGAGPAPSAAQLEEWQAMVTQAGEPRALARLRDLARDGSADAQAALGVALVDAREPGLRDEGRGWLETAAQADGAIAAPAARRAQLALGKALLLGSGGLPKDYARARTLLGAAAEHGDPAAAYYLGLIYRSGYGVAADPVQAARWFEAASHADIPAADFMLANAYRDGSGVPRDDARALALYRRAAEHELPEAVQTLAMAYRNGELGLKPDADEFHAQWIETAHALKHPVIAP